MKIKTFIMACIALWLVVLTGCSKTNVNTRYYIKYEVDVTSPYSGNMTYITVNTDGGELSFNTGKVFSETFGPVDRDFVAKAEVYTKAYDASVNVRIYACRGEESFVLKKTKTGNNPKQTKPLVVEYRIDF